VCRTTPWCNAQLLVVCGGACVVAMLLLYRQQLSEGRVQPSAWAAGEQPVPTKVHEDPKVEALFSWVRNNGGTLDERLELRDG